jgi:hypothetical protein
VKMEQSVRQEQSLELRLQQLAESYNKLERENDREKFETEKRSKTRRREQVEILKSARGLLGPEGFSKWIAANGISRTTAYRQLREVDDPGKAKTRRAKDRKQKAGKKASARTLNSGTEINQEDTDMTEAVTERTNVSSIDRIEMEARTHIERVKHLTAEVEARRMAIGALMVRAKRTLGDPEFAEWLKRNGWPRISVAECMTLAKKEAAHAAT